MDLARAPRRAARKKGSGYENAADPVPFSFPQPFSLGHSLKIRLAEVEKFSLGRIFVSKRQNMSTQIRHFVVILVCENCYGC